jgi:hypothetical protein
MDNNKDIGKVISKTLQLDKSRYYETHLSIINAVLPVRLTSMEIEVLAAFMEFNIKEDVLGTTARKKVREKLNLSHGGLSNYIRSFQDKNVIFADNSNSGNTMFINPLLIPNEIEQNYMFKLIQTN